MLEQPLSHIEVRETADRVAVDLKKLVTKFIVDIYSNAGSIVDESFIF